MFNGSIINQSPTSEFVTAAGLSGAAFTAVTLTENGVKTSAADEMPIGILTAENELPIEAGEHVTVQTTGGSLCTAGEALKAGDFLAAGASGVAVKAAAGKFIFAQALDNAAQGATAHVQIIRAGKL